MRSGEVKFELERLTDRDDAALLDEVRRVAAQLLAGEPLTVDRFDASSKVSSSTLRRRFGGWQKALLAAGVGDRYSGRTVSMKMRSQVARGVDTAALIEELQRVAASLGVDSLSQAQFAENSQMSAAAVTRRLGSWRTALSAAGLRPVSMGRRYSDEDYFENLLSVWMHLGRQPRYREMSGAPSTISPGAYEQRFGGWTKALVAFVEYANRTSSSGVAPVATQQPDPLPAPKRGPEDQRTIPLGLRYDVLKRDRFKCVLCGRNPATDPTCVLHIDHIQAFSRDGKTRPENLRTLCSDCNIGKAAKPA